MHMADSLLSPAVGGVMWATSATLLTYASRKVQNDLDDKQIPMMGVLGAFVFAAQMINFTIPGTGSSGHLGGGMILAIILGSNAGFLAMASILAIQALFFADGGLLALGSNIFNLGFYTCFIAYPFIYKAIIKKGITTKRIFIASMLSGIIGLQMGSLSVVLQTQLSGISDLPFTSFLLLMQPIHLGIGIVEGLVTAAVVSFIWQVRPELLEGNTLDKTSQKSPMKKLLVGLLMITLLTGGLLSWYASENPDGLEWSMYHASGKEELEATGGLYSFLNTIQEKVAFLPDYGFKQGAESSTTVETDTPTKANLGTTTAGIVGGAITLVFTVLFGYFLSKLKKIRKTAH